ncbi:hypothetical protein U9M48_026051 [Paspalum notatum var. saurae]|uniref:RING-CH-type domain-containing protein n=1 Tax=Paspalum notatum var. saurae TaxID=547442 RepID=A0AAQ3TRE2_PASNO
MGDGGALCGDIVDLPIIQHDDDDDDGGGGGETENGGSSSCAKKLKNKPPSVTSCLLPTRSLRSTAAAQPQIITPHQTSCSQQAEGGGGGIRSLSFSKILSFRLPSCLDYIDQLADNHDTAAAAAADNKEEEEEEEEEEELKQVCRSQSVPTSVRRFNGAGSRSSERMRRVADYYASSLIGPAGGLAVRLIRVVPFATTAATTGDDHQKKQQQQQQQQDEQQDIAAEEAVCRICMVALSESEEEVLKLECCCKGELALAHRACAIKWFSIKGNGTCDVCSQEVRNLPVTLRRLHGHPTAIQAAVALVQLAQDAQHQAAASAGSLDPTTTTGSNRRFRVWHGTPILVIISMLAYFCFLEQLLVGDHGTAALAISLPFACVLGLFSSLTTAKMVARTYVWIYSAVQFLFIVLFTHLFYRYVGMQAVISIILSTFAGFSVTICTNSVLLQILRWRARALQTATTTGDLSSREPPVPDLEIALPPL